MNETRTVFFLFLTLERVLLKSKKTAFKDIKEEAEVRKRYRKKECLRELGSRKGKIARIVLWMIKTGGINVQQRGFLRWKFNVFTIITPQRELYINADRFSILRSIVTIPKNFYRQMLITMINRWKKTVFSIKVHEKRKNFGLNLMIHCTNRQLYLWFQKLMEYSKWLLRLKLKLRYINRIFLRNFQKPFENFKLLGYYYEDYVIETVVKKDKVTKNFKIMHKPATQLEYYDLKTYDPAFRAVCRNMGHFLKRKKNLYFRTWKFFTETQRKSIEALQGFLQDSKKTEKFKLGSEKLRMLKKLLIEFCVIQEKVCQMPENCIARWSEKAHIKALKEIKFKILTLRSQRLDQKKKLFFASWKQAVEYSHAFTDLE